MLENKQVNFWLEFGVKSAGLKKAEKELIRLNKIVHKRIGKEIPHAFEIVTRKVTYQMNKQQQMLKRTAVVWKTEAGKMMRTIYTLNRATGKLSASTGMYTQAMGAHGKSIGGIIGRAAQTIPVWMAMRGAMMAVMSTIREGTQYWLEFEKEMLRVESVVHGVTGSIDGFMEKLEKRIDSISSETGIKMADLANAFYRFGTVGNEAEESMIGMEEASRGAVSMLGDTKETAMVMARAIKLLGDTMDESLPIQERHRQLWAKIYTLYQDNDFVSKDLNQSMIKFLSTAKSLGVPLNELIALLGTLNSAQIRSGRAGQLSKTAFLKMYQNLDKVGTTLGLHVNPKLETTTEIFYRIIDKVREFRKIGDIPKVTEAFKNIFGGVKGSEIVHGLVAIGDQLDKNRRVMNAHGEELEKMVEIYDKRYLDVIGNVSRQVEIYHNNIKKIGKSFVSSTLGGKNFGDTLQTKINPALEKANKFAKSAGKAIGWLFRQAADPSVLTRSVEDFIKKIVLSKAKDGIPLPIKIDPKMKDEMLKQIKQFMDEISTASPQEIRTKVSTDVQKRINLEQQTIKYLELQAAGATEVEVAHSKLTDYVAELVRQYDLLVPAQEKFKNDVSTSQILSLALQGNWEEIANLLELTGDKQKELNTLNKLAVNIEKAKIKAIKKYSDELKKSFSSATAELIKGESTILEFYENIGNKIRDALAKKISESLIQGMFNATGIGETYGAMMGQFDTMFSKDSFGGQIQQSVVTSAPLFSRAIIDGCVQGAGILRSAVTGAGAGARAGGFSAAAGGGLGGLPLFAGGGGAGMGGGIMGGVGGMSTGTQMTPYGAAGTWSPYIGNTLVGGSGFFGKKLGKWWGGGQMTMGGGIGAFAMGALSGFQQGIPQGISGGVGSLLAMAGHPLLALPFLLFSLFGKKKKTTQKTTTWTPEEVKEMYPAVGMDIAPLPKMWSLPKSRYHARNNPISININIGNMQGTDKDMAERIGKQVELHVSKALPINYRRGIERGEISNRLIF